ncbi:hypothetical protein P152DRAFT_403475 [Eremomyces bilateralis CBS 781.70]|uniref:Zn(2)-C6 fungal-type domain-containing protein n=1 Tax=Eremomyces bilateralis CBS 781.70 TaxID=1392243 RepID=A0A6G1FUE5_9PEZI|nr:uncharacterized protein P152DRAFT_403475 [Eremomyces bilateralis CBS 781.70]KAF1809370.1 hypothetical protein P152DRAFT_403475 [Eremomyces bilateralis CBS 781.70]
MADPKSAQPRTRAQRACIVCHKRKIKCDLETCAGPRCTNCLRDEYECIPRERKRKRFTMSPSPSGGRPAGRLKREPPNPRASLSNPSMMDPVYQPQRSISDVDGTNLTEVSPKSMAGAANHSNSTPPGAVTGQPHYPHGGPNTSYLGRSSYIAVDVPLDDEEAPEIPQNFQTLNDRDVEVLGIQRVFELPPRAIRESLIDHFWERCWPWTPIVDRSWLKGRNAGMTNTMFDPEGESGTPSILLLQAMLLAGSRVSTAIFPSPTSGTSANKDITPGFGPEDFYRRAKTLFWTGSERDPLLITVAACLLNWWNPEGPEHFSTDTSGFWLRISVGLAYQIGLHKDPGDSSEDSGIRRRIFWSLVVRDCLINAGHGRPRAINLQLADVLPPTAKDFDGDERAAELFRHYIGISLVLGDLTQVFLSRAKFQPEQKLCMDNAVFRWLKTLPEHLQLCHHTSARPLRSYHFEARQLHVQYFTVLTILNRAQNTSGPPSTASVLASSFVVGIFEDFLARDEVRFLGPIFTFYLLSAGIAQLSCYRYPGLWHLAQQDLEVIFRSQNELAKRWPSAIGALKTLADVRSKISGRQKSTYFPDNNLTEDQAQFFVDFGPDLAREWNVLYGSQSHRCGNGNMPDESNRQVATRDLMTAGILSDLQTQAQGAAPADDVSAGRGLLPTGMAPDEAANGASGMYHQEPLLDSVPTTFDYDGIGNWLFNDWDATAMW